MVVGKDYSVWDPVIGGDTAEVIVGFQDICKCKINPSLQIVPSGSSRAIKTSVRFTLVLTSKHWEVDSHGDVRESEGHPQWRINVDTAESPVWLTVSTAIRYVRDMRNQSHDPATRKNADETLAKLSRLP